MTGYVPKDAARIMRAVISPVTARAILAAVDLHDVERKMRMASVPVQQTVRQELEELRIAAAQRADRETPQQPPVSAPVPSSKPREQWLSVVDAAQLLGISDRTVRNYIRAGALEAKKKDKKSYMVSRESVEALLLVRAAA